MNLLSKICMISLLLFFFQCTTDKKEEKNKTEIVPQQTKRIVELEYFKTENGWGYDVIINGKNYIHQVHLPCECGGEGFTTKEKAMIAGEFLKKKIENNERKLYISRAQLDSLGAL